MASGLVEWSNAIRFTIANDPGRNLFRDQVNVHGFMFLEDYLANILEGASKPDPMIELVKTPGRKKPLLKKPKTASKLNQSISSQSPGEDETYTMDEGLASARGGTTLHPESQARHTQHATHDYVKNNILAPHHGSSTLNLTVPASQPAEPMVPSHLEQKDLSVIAEDDEHSDMSHKESSPRKDPSHNDIAAEQKSVIFPSELPSTPNEELAHNTTGASLQISQGICLASIYSPENTIPSSSSLPSVTGSNSTLHCHAERTALVPENGMLASSGILSPDYVGAQKAIASTSSSSQEIVDPIRDPDPILTSSDAEGKFGTMLYPVLPGPMPLRKSIRAPRDPSMNAAPSNAATPGATLGGKRTSWLKKAREAKALETTSRSTVASTSTGLGGSKSLKRKSGDVELTSTTTGMEGEERRYKSAKNVDSDVAPSIPKASESVMPALVPDVRIHTHVRLSPEPRLAEKAPVEQEGMLDRFKRTVEGLGARVGKSMGKSLGVGAAAAALAEARAAAEARVAERVTKKEELRIDSGSNPINDVVTSVEVTSMDMETESQLQGQRRLSISDLFPPQAGSPKMKSRNGGNGLSANRTVYDTWNTATRDSTTTTPPDSPSAICSQSPAPPSAPVFNKPPPVFIPPGPVSKYLSPPAGSQMSGIRPSPSSRIPETLFERFAVENFGPSGYLEEHERGPLIPHAQGPEYSSRFEPQLQNNRAPILEEIDIWSTNSNRITGVHWTLGTSKDDSLTWSTLPSQQGETGPLPRNDTLPDDAAGYQVKSIIPTALDMHNEYNEECVFQASTLDLGEPETRSESQMSFVSSQSQVGFGNSTSKLLNNTSGTNKKGKSEVKKVLQMAAVAARKQQEENDKKAARLKEMENRRQLATQRKVEEEKFRAQEQERKMKEEGERRKRDREDNTEKRPSKLTTASKKEEEGVKKRKVTVAETEKKEIKKPLSKPVVKSTIKPPMALSSSAAFNASAQSIAIEKGKAKLPPPSLKRTQGLEDDFSKPSQIVQTQMAARAKAQLQAAQMILEPIPSENIELPDINSEYSDSEDEDRPKTFDPPGWAQSPELREALHLQSTINPDDIFGAIQPLKMEELFKTRTSRFRARTSSANWTGADRLTLEEEREYAKRMGFK